MNLPRLRPRHTVIPAHAVRDSAGVLAVMSGVARKGPWELARKFRIATVMGSAEIDLREAVLAEGESHIEIFCLFGSVEIVVPSGVEVVVDGDAFVGEFSHKPDPSVRVEPGAPRIVIHGNAAFGSVECESRLAGESEGQAKKRIRLARRSG
jgi:Cell wall-active antibiotics response 4TMS YvqF